MKGWEEFDAAAYIARVRGTAIPAKKRGKYGAVPTEVDGHRFASKHEATRYEELKLEMQAGTITGLQLHERFPLHVLRPDGVKVCIGEWHADFSYVRDGRRTIEDVKGMKGLPLFLWKKKHAEAEHAIVIAEIR